MVAVVVVVVVVLVLVLVLVIVLYIYIYTTIIDDILFPFLTRVSTQKKSASQENESGS